MTKNIYFMLKTFTIFLDESGGKYDLFTKLMFNEGVGLRYVQKNVERNEALHCTHAFVQMPKEKN